MLLSMCDRHSTQIDDFSRTKYMFGISSRLCLRWGNQTILFTVPTGYSRSNQTSLWVSSMFMHLKSWYVRDRKESLIFNIRTNLLGHLIGLLLSIPFLGFRRSSNHIDWSIHPSTKRRSQSETSIARTPRSQTRQAPTSVARLFSRQTKLYFTDRASSFHLLHLLFKALIVGQHVLPRFHDRVNVHSTWPRRFLIT